MQLLRLLTLVLFAGAYAAPVAATEYFACDCANGADAQCVAGNDAAAGTAPNSPWQSYDRAQDAWGTLAAGDAINFCRGGVFPLVGSTRWVNSNCRVAQPCTIGAYQPPWGSGDEARPRLVQSAGHGFDLGNAGNAAHEEGYLLRDLELLCTGCTELSGWFGIFFFNDVDDVRLERLRVEGFGVGVHLAASNACGPDPNCDARNLRIAMIGSEIVNNGNQGWLGASDDLLLANNLFDGNGSGSAFQHNVYLNQSNVTTARIRILRNELYRSSLDTNGVCQGGTFASHGIHTDLLIEGNYVHEDIGAAAPGCWGIGMTPAYASAESFVRAIVRGNTVRNVGNTAIAIGACSDCVIENNLIEHEQNFGFVGLGAPAVANGAGDAPLQRLTVRNNSLYVGGSGTGTGLSVGAQGSGHIIVSNAIQSMGSSGAWSCFSFDLPSVAYLTIDNNVCGFTPAPGRAWEQGSGALATWQSASGFDLASQEAPPGFAAPGAPLHDLRAVGPNAAMVGGGHPSLSAVSEFYGGQRGTPVDAGAFQFGHEAPIFRNSFEYYEFTGTASRR